MLHLKSWEQDIDDWELALASRRKSLAVVRRLKFRNAKSHEAGASAIALACVTAAVGSGFAGLTTWVVTLLSVTVIAARLLVAYSSYRSDPVHKLAADWRETSPKPDLVADAARSRVKECRERFVDAMQGVTMERHWLEDRLHDATKGQRTITAPSSTRVAQDYEGFLQECAIQLSEVARICHESTDIAAREHNKLAASKDRSFLTPSFFAYLCHGLTP